jgi:hypothetical protein
MMGALGEAPAGDATSRRHVGMLPHKLSNPQREEAGRPGERRTAPGLLD